MVFQHSGGRDFDLPRHSHYSAQGLSRCMVFQHSVVGGEILTLFPADDSHYSGVIPMVFQHSGGRDFMTLFPDTPTTPWGYPPMVFQHSGSRLPYTLRGRPQDQEHTEHFVWICMKNELATTDGGDGRTATDLHLKILNTSGVTRTMVTTQRAARRARGGARRHSASTVTHAYALTCRMFDTTQHRGGWECLWRSHTPLHSTNLQLHARIGMHTHQHRVAGAACAHHIVPSPLQVQRAPQ